MNDFELQQAIHDAKAAEKQRDDGLRAALETLNEVIQAYSRSPYRRQQKIATRAIHAQRTINELRGLINES